MKRVLLLALPVLAISLMALQPANDPLPIGSPIPSPDTKMKDISGKEVSFKDAMKKNGLLIMFSCNTCPVVGKYQSRTLETGKQAARNDIGVVLLNSNEATRDQGESFSEMQNYGKEQGYDFSYLVDEKSTMADLFGASRTPEVYLFDKKGILVYHGAIDDNSNGPDLVTRKHVSIAIEEMIGGKDVSTKQTRSVGCGIKRLN